MIELVGEYNTTSYPSSYSLPSAWREKLRSGGELMLLYTARATSETSPDFKRPSSPLLGYAPDSISGVERFDMSFNELGNDVRYYVRVMAWTFPGFYDFAGADVLAFNWTGSANQGTIYIFCISGAEYSSTQTMTKSSDWRFAQTGVYTKRGGCVFGIAHVLADVTFSGYYGSVIPYAASYSSGWDRCHYRKYMVPNLSDPAGLSWSPITSYSRSAAQICFDPVSDGSDIPRFF